MTGKWHIAMTTVLAVLAGAATSRADELALQPKEPKKEAKKELPKEPPKLLPKKEVIIEIGKQPKDFLVEVRTPGYLGPVGVAYGVWPGPVLPGMWGGVWGGLWPNSWWMGGPYLYTGWTGPWGAGLARDFGPYPSAGKYYDSCCFSCGSGAHPWLLPPVFRNYQVPAVSPYWVPRQPVFWIAPSAAPPAIFPGAPAPMFGPAPIFGPVLVRAPVVVPKPRELKIVPVPKKVSTERLYIDALALYFEDNFESSRNHLDAAVKQTPSDARLWYYKALAEKAMGDDSAARNSAEKGAALEILGVTEKRSILTSLERIQGVDRKFLSDLVSGPKSLSLQSASDIVAKLKASESTSVTSAK